jgi:hypothetical protein
MKKETEATEARYDSTLNQIRENKLRNKEGLRVWLNVKRRGVLEKVWTDYAEARTRFAIYRLRKDYNDLSEKGKLLIETQTEMDVWLIHPANVGPGLRVDDPRIVEEDMEEWALKGFRYDTTFPDEYDLWINPDTMQNLRRYKDGSVWLTNLKTGDYEKVEKYPAPVLSPDKRALQSSLPKRRAPGETNVAQAGRPAESETRNEKVSTV